jgi:hypothetical protein
MADFAVGLGREGWNVEDPPAVAKKRKKRLEDFNPRPSFMGARETKEGDPP